ncbi:DUF1801 domain-containing protein [Actinomycetospora soli]|uniref:DUF1801 domain-containing protein n=1 Tax=Actinomycetospora soli TaxID=2893887 RepID=UPI001E4F7080|nr:DUF1801 domain-containing protein [Actinomycetospora soli]MCD2187799.1 DUF1801 domain-containing protein [Actinomycetospora soli]
MTDEADGSDLASFLADLRDEQATIAREVHATVADVAPELLPPTRRVALLGYGAFHYRYASGREGDADLVSLRGGSKHLSVFVSAVDDGWYLPEIHAAALGAVSVGRSCIRVRRAGDLDLSAFADVVRRAVAVGGEGQV